MNLRKFIIFTAILCLLLLNIGNIYAYADLDNSSYDNIKLDENSINLDETDDLLEFNGNNINKSLEYNDEIILDTLSDSKIITVEPDVSNPNQVVIPTVQPAIDNANPGDTLILKGNFAHCHFVINKKLNIIAEEGTTLGACPHYKHDGVDEFGIFYVTDSGSGSMIRGFNFINNAKSINPFTFFINGASNVSIINCTMNYTEKGDYKFSGIIIQNSNNISLSNLIVENTINGIKIINSSNVKITNNIISDNSNNAIAVVGTSNNIDIINNEISNNKYSGINLASANFINVINNLIEKNGVDNYDTGSGIYVNTNITKLIVKGNIFLENGLHAIMYDYRARNLNADEGAEQLTIINNNYFSLHTSMVLHHRIYIEHPQGTLKYDAENDVFGSVGEGRYMESKSYVYMQYAFLDDDVPCGFTYYTPEIPWTLEALLNDGKYDFSLKLSDVEQIKTGVYQVSIVDSQGNVANDFNSFYMTFALNSQLNKSYQNVLIKNGIATADFNNISSSFDNTSVIAIFPSTIEKIHVNNEIYLVSEDNTSFPFPENKINVFDLISSTLLSFKLTTYPLSDVNFEAKLMDINGNPLSNQIITFKLKGVVYNSKTDLNGIAKLKISLTSKRTYYVDISYGGNDKYKSSKSTSKIIIKTGSKKSVIKASKINAKKNKKKTFKFKLISKTGIALKYQKVSVKLNGKTYIIKTNKLGIGKLSFKLKKAKNIKLQ